MPRFRPERPLPPYPHRPGHTPHPLRDPEGHGVTGASPRAPFPPELWLLVDDCGYAADLFQAGFFWEAHELWEGLWAAAEDARQRALFKGLVQTAAALVHQRDGRPEAARTLAARAAGHLAAAGGVLCGIDTEALRAELADLPSGGPALRLPLTLRGRDRAGLATERWVLAPILETEERDGSLVLRTPAQPTFYDGHCLLLDRAPAAAEVEPWLDRCRDWVGGVARQHQHIAWEDQVEHWDGAAPAGVSLDEYVALSTRRPPGAAPVPAGFRLAPATSDDDWLGAASLGVAICLEAGLGGDVPGFMRQRYEFFRERATGAGDRFWVALDQRGQVAASLGLLASPHVFRFQDVQVRADARGRGLATALVTRALADAFGHFPGAAAVLVAEQHSQAERLYRRLGFQTASYQHWLRRRAG